jgi:type IV pilus assembly protein PilB
MNKKLGELLIEAGIISEDKLHEVLAKQKETGRRIGEVIVDMQLALEDEIQDILGRQLGVPKIDLYEERIDPDIARLVPPDMIKRHQAFPVRKEGSHLIVAMVDPLNLLAIDDFRLSTGMEITPYITSPSAISFAFDQFFGVSHEAQKSIEEFQQDRLKKGYVIDESLVDRATLREIEDAPIVKLVDTILNGAADYRASDIHLEPKGEAMTVRYRVDGMLHKILIVPKNAVPAVTARLKIMAKLDTSERRKPQDGRIELSVADAQYDIRFSTLPTLFGEKIVMRLLNKSSQDYKLTDLGYDEEELSVWNTLIEQPHGIILITGPTGSGKSTTLITSLAKLATEQVNIVTIEDPVEYQLDAINQVHVNPKVGLTFASGMRTIVRQDPDIIMVGEIRDGETADLAVNAALTGHLVLSTLHTNDAPGAIPRLENMGVPAYLMNASIIGIMAQRLLRKLCPHCKEAYEASEEELVYIKGAFNPDQYQGKSPLFYRPKGCKFCKHVGFTGRTGIFEIFRMSNLIKDLITKTTSIHLVKAAARREGMLTLWESGVKKVLLGQTSLSELLRVARPDYETDVEVEPMQMAARGGGVRGGLTDTAPKLAEVEGFEV